MIGETVEAVLTDDAVSKLTDAVQADGSLQPSSGRGIIKSPAEFKEKFDAGEISTRISPQKQRRHIYGSAEFEQDVHNFQTSGSDNLPAYIRPDLSVSDLEEQVVAKLTGNAIMKNDGSFIEYLYFDDVIGCYYSPDAGSYIETKCVQVKYSLGSRNIHVIPAKEYLDGGK